VYVTHDQVEAMTLATRVAVMRGGRIEQHAAPEELYERPETLFVAGFVGSPAMNMLPATLVGGEAPRLRAEGLDVSLREYPFRAAPQDGQPVILGLRPEHVGLAEPGFAGEALEADTLLTEPMGADTLAWFQLGAQRISARLTPQRARALPARVRLALDMQHASLFDQASEQRL
jgi:multiple sugar transport system ATP-binding protein